MRGEVIRIEVMRGKTFKVAMAFKVINGIKDHLDERCTLHLRH